MSGWNVKDVIKSPYGNFLGLLVFVHGVLADENKQTFTASDARVYGNKWINQVPGGPERNKRSKTTSNWWISAHNSGYLMARPLADNKKSHEYTFNPEFIRLYLSDETR
ncbi:MAG: hypothetical protein GW865_04530 [Candidatus Aenigmarchaeota archaeon]|nr:hypothetical protein [Candidatus Aenigmarchaeota archaeon]